MSTIFKVVDWLGVRFEFLQRLQGSLLLSPVLLTGILVVALLGVGQIREVLIYAVEPQSGYCGVHVAAGFASLALLSATIFYGYLSACVVLRKAGIGYGSSLSYKSDIELTRDRWLVGLRNIFAITCAAGPLIAIGLVFRATGFQVAHTARLSGGAEFDIQSVGWLPDGLCAGDGPGRQLAAHLIQVGNLWLAFSVVFLIVLYISAHTIFVCKGRLWQVSTWGLSSCPTRTRRGYIMMTAALAILLVPIPLLRFAPASHDSLYVWLGPLATLGLVLAATAWLLFVIGESSKKSGLPWFLIIAILVFGLGLFTWMQRASTGTPLTVRQESTEEPSELHKAFVDWLSERDKVLGSASREPYPVYIVAAPGGGIYAAAYVTSVMSQLEARCPGFSQHVFAISAVSGGAIGSTIVNAVTRGELRNGPITCDAFSQEAEAWQEGVKKIVSRDHLSPTLGTTVPDVIWKLGQIFTYELASWAGLEPGSPQMTGGRAEALERSFSTALKAAEGQICKQKPCDLFNQNFDRHFRPKEDGAPALLLNTTWAETGARITFSPFSLNGVGDDTLLAMKDLKGAKQAKLIEAAVASARFPAVLPAKVLYPEDKLWWNFVDGGYADASGTTTALEVYNELHDNKSKLEERAKRTFVLKLIIITESNGDIRFNSDSDAPSGHGWIHAISPITTLLTIREQMGRRAVARALSELEELKPNVGKAAARCWQVVRIALNPGKLNLPLGWLLSHHTVDAIAKTIVRENREALDGIERSLMYPRSSCLDYAGGLGRALYSQ